MSLQTVKSVTMWTFILVMGAFTDMMMRMNLTMDAEVKKSLDPSLQYMHSIAMHHVGGKPFLDYMAEAVKTNREVVFDGSFNVTDELMKFSEGFTLKNATGGVILKKPGQGRSVAFYPIPPGGVLEMRYRWVE